MEWEAIAVGLQVDKRLYGVERLLHYMLPAVGSLLQEGTRRTGTGMPWLDDGSVRTLDGGKSLATENLRVLGHLMLRFPSNFFCFCILCYYLGGANS